jgi:hypothetical protein
MKAARLPKTANEPENKSDTMLIDIETQSIPVFAWTAAARSSMPRIGPATRLPLVLAGVSHDMRDTLNANVPILTFPYDRHVATHGRLCVEKHELVNLQNSRWRVIVAPSFGGRVMSIFDKANNAELLWRPPVIRNNLIGLAGAWFVGGIEFNAFRFGHQVFGQTTVKTSRVTLSGGWEGVRLEAVDELYGCSWEVTISLHEDRVAMHVRLENHSSKPQPGYWWTNIAAPMHERTRLFFEPGPILHHGIVWQGFRQATWPTIYGSDWSNWTNHSEIFSGYLHANASRYCGYCDTNRRLAVIHAVDPCACPGKKLWSVSSRYQAGVWWDNLAEQNLMQYVEIQSGRSRTQLQTDLIMSGEAVEWTESLSAACCGGEGDYGHAWSQFHRAAENTLLDNDAVVDSADNWKTVSCEVLIEPHWRLAASEAIVRNSKAVSLEDAEKVCALGWVAGEHWLDRLQSLSAQEHVSSNVKLAMAGAMMDAGQGSQAAGVLEEIRGEHSLAGAYACCLLALNAKAASRLKEALSWINLAIEKSQQTQFYLIAHDLLLGQSDLAGMDALWRKAPPLVRKCDSARVARAHLAFLQGQWSQARGLLADPLPTVGEGEFFPWLLAKEAYLAEAFSAALSSDMDTAQAIAAGASDQMRQFGIGRDEQRGNGDVLYYRWLFARLAGHHYVADSLASHVLSTHENPGSLEAAYACRMAWALGDPTAARRLDELVAWQEGENLDVWHAAAVWKACIASVQGNGVDSWADLAAHPLFGHRAKFEVAIMGQSR